MAYKNVRVCLRFDELEFARLEQCLGFNGCWDKSRFVRQAVRAWCEHVEAERRRAFEATADKPPTPAIAEKSKRPAHTRPNARFLKT